MTRVTQLTGDRVRWESGLSDLKALCCTPYSPHLPSPSCSPPQIPRGKEPLKVTSRGRQEESCSPWPGTEVLYGSNALEFVGECYSLVSGKSNCTFCTHKALLRHTEDGGLLFLLPPASPALSLPVLCFLRSTSRQRQPAARESEWDRECACRHHAPPACGGEPWGALGSPSGLEETLGSCLFRFAPNPVWGGKKRGPEKGSQNPSECIYRHK